MVRYKSTKRRVRKSWFLVSLVEPSLLFLNSGSRSTTRGTLRLQVVGILLGRPLRGGRVFASGIDSWKECCLGSVVVDVIPALLLEVLGHQFQQQVPARHIQPGLFVFNKSEPVISCLSFPLSSEKS